MKKYILFIIIATFLPISASAQKNSDHKQWWKAMQEYKHDFIAKEIGLSDEQKEKFFPIYNEMEAAIFKLNKETRQLEKKINSNEQNISDIEYEKAAEAMFELKAKEGAVEESYLKKFSAVLTPKQLFKLKIAERKFTREVMKHHNRMKSKGK